MAALLVRSLYRGNLSPFRAASNTNLSLALNNNFAGLIRRFSTKPHVDVLALTQTSVTKLKEIEMNYQERTATSESENELNSQEERDRKSRSDPWLPWDVDYTQDHNFSKSLEACKDNTPTELTPANIEIPSCEFPTEIEIPCGEITSEIVSFIFN